MKHLISSALVFSFLFFGATPFALAHEGIDDETEFTITFDDLNLRQPKLLPGDSLYFLKNWQRDVRRAFSFGALRGATFRSDLMNEFVAEVIALKDQEDSKEGLKIALRKYQENALRLREKITFLEQTGRNNKTDDLLDVLIEQLVKHEAVFSEVGDFPEAEEELKEAKGVLEAVAAEAITRLDSPDSFKTRLEKITLSLRENHLKELRVVYALNYIEEKVPEEVRSKIRELETDLISRFEGRFKAEPEEVAPHLNFLPVKGARDLGIFDEIRERVTYGSLKSKLNAVRQDAVRSGSGKIVEGETLIEIIQDAEEAAGELKKRISSDDYVSSKTVEELLERAEFHLAQATDLLKEGNEETALGQATAASATAENGLSQVRPKEEIEEENLSLRIKFDELVSRTRAKNLTRALDPELYDRFDEIERVIVGAYTATELREVKVMLAEIEVIIVNKK